MRLHLTYLKHMALYKMLVGKKFGKHRFYKDITALQRLQSRGGSPNFPYVLRPENALVQGVNQPLKVVEI